MKKKKKDIELKSEESGLKGLNETENLSSNEEILTKRHISDDEKQAILNSRAQAIAAEEIEEVLNEEYIDVLEFSLAKENYAVETSFVREVYSLKNYTVLPGLPPFVLGILNVRGQIISVIDLKKFFNLPSKGLGELNKVIIIKNESMEFGILADIIIGNHLIATSSIVKTRSAKSEIGNDYLKGVTSEHLIVLDTNNILNDEKIIINQESK